MRYLPHTDEDIRNMFDAIGVKDFEELFMTVPESCRYDKEMALPEPKTEWNLDKYMAEIQSMMKITSEHTVLIGAGRYQHHIPSSISSVLGRSEFLTAYTPYQPEMAQGTLQAVSIAVLMPRSWASFSKPAAKSGCSITSPPLIDMPPPVFR